MDFLSGIPEHRVREAYVEGFDALRKQGRSTFDYSDAVGQVARICLGQKAGEATARWAAGQRSFKTPPSAPLEEWPDNRRLLSALWSLVGEGIVVPRLKQENDLCVFLRLTLTEKGERVVSKADEHPLHPGFIKRFRASAPTATDPVIAHMEDAVSCLEAGVLRPALMMVGVANEVTVRVTHDALAHQNKVTKAGAMAKMRDLLADISAVAGTWAAGGGTRDEEHRLKMAVGGTEAVRDERNKAAHPGQKVTDAPHVESMLMLAAHHLPVLWELMVKPAKAVGFVP